MNGRPIVGKLFYQMQVEGKRDWSYLSSKYEPPRVYGVFQHVNPQWKVVRVK